MTKDSANSYDQMRWEHAAEEHARLVAYRSKYSPVFIQKRGEWINSRIEKLEAEYPQLRAKDQS